MAATCCLRLPEETGVPVSVSRLEQPRLPAIMVGEGVSALLTTAFLRESEQAYLDSSVKKRHLEFSFHRKVPDPESAAGSDVLLN
jgi:hypothetical protein